MRKKSVSTSIEHELFNRISRLAKVDRRSIAEVVAVCIERGLPEVERDIETRGEPPPPLSTEVMELLKRFGKELPAMQQAERGTVSYDPSATEPAVVNEGPMKLQPKKKG